MTTPQSTLSMIVVLWGLLVPSLTTAAPAPGRQLQYFKLEPAVQDTVYRLLVIPVRFPEDRILGGGEREGLEAKLNGLSKSLSAYYRTATGGRLRVVATLAPTVVAGEPRSWYTCTNGPPDPAAPCLPQYGCSNGIQPSAYPHNSRRLVEEVTSKLSNAVDFRAYDNTGDGITDGLLLLHSGPPAPENGVNVPCDALLAHSFELETPVERGGAQIFPYSVAATTDGIGVWAHETGHLLGFTDLYHSNGFCPGPGLGDWALMATGATVGGGDNPSGLSAYTRQLLGLLPTPVEPTPQRLDEMEYLRLWRPGEENGPQYFLLEHRSGDNGLSTPSDAWILTLVDETEGANTGCSTFLTEIRAVVCTEPQGCDTVLNDFTVPSTRDANGQPTGLELRFVAGEVQVFQMTFPRVRVRRIRTTEPGGTSQEIHLEIANLSSTANPVTVRATALDGPWCLERPPGGQPLGIELPPQGSATLGPWTARSCDSAPFPVGEISLRVELTDATSTTRVDTFLVVLGSNGLVGDPSTYTVETHSSAANPWVLKTDGEWRAGPFAPFADASVVTPRLRVPDGGRLLLQHLWFLYYLAPDLAFDGAQVQVEREGEPPARIDSGLPWGYEVLRTSGSGLAGQDVLSAHGSRWHSLDLSAYSGETVRIHLRVASDFDGSTGFWAIQDLRVTDPSGGFTLRQVGDTRTVEVVPDPGVDPGLYFFALYEGAGATSPTQWVAATTPRDEDPKSFVLSTPGPLARLSLIWSYVGGRSGGGYDLRLTLPALGSGNSLHLHAEPNPLRVGGGSQTWGLDLGPDTPAGDYTVRLFDLRGRLLRTVELAVDQPGQRTTEWDGRDDFGTPVVAGVYFLQAEAPDGNTQTLKLVVVP